MTDVETRAAILAEKHRRLRIAAQAVLDEARAVGDAEHPEAGIPAHVLRRLRRELSDRYEPQPSTSWFTMSADS